MSDIAIRVENLGKQYRIGAQVKVMTSHPNDARYLRPGVIGRLRAAHAAGRVHWSRMWAVEVLEAWQNRMTN